MRCGFICRLLTLCRLLGLCGLLRVTVGAFAIPLGLTFAVLAFLFFAALFHFAHRFAQHPQIMFGVLLEIFGGHAIIAQLRVARQLVVFVDDLLRCAAHFAFGAGTVEHTVHNISA